MDRALGAIYGGADGFGGGAGSGPSSPQLSRWLGDLRALFSPMEVQVIQNDAIRRKGLNQLLFEPEVLDQLEPSIGTAALLLTLKDQIPSCARENARAYIAKIVEDINRRLADDLKRSVPAGTLAHSLRQCAGLPHDHSPKSETLRHAAAGASAGEVLLF